jgi:peptide/nickel transport system permease protein
VALSIAYVPIIARVVRSAALKERNLPYVAALHVQGASGWTICLRHVVPNLLPLIVVQSAIGFGYAMLDLAAISFLGLGIQPPSPDWGVMVAGGQSAILDGNPQQSLYAAAVVVVAVVSFNLVGQRLAQLFQLEEHA